MDGSVGDLEAEPVMNQETRYKQVLGLSDIESHSLVTFTFSQSTEIVPTNDNETVYDKQFIAKMESIRGTYLADIVNKVIIMI